MNAKPGQGAWRCGAWKHRLGRPAQKLALIVALASGILTASVSLAAQPRAAVQGVEDRRLREEIEQAVGDEKTAPESRIEARRRARQAADSAEALLRSEGFYDYTIEPDIGEGDTPNAVVNITVGPRSTFAAPKIEWQGPTPADDVKSTAGREATLKEGAPGRAADVLAAEGRIVSTLQQGGYADAAPGERQVVVDHADQTVRPTFRIAAGALTHMDGIVLKSKGRTKRKWVEKLIPWRKGDVYKPNAVGELERRLLDTGVYDSVTVALAPAPDASGLRPVLVSLADRSRNTLEFGAGYSTTEGSDVDIKVSSYDIFGYGDTLTYEIRYASIDSRAGVEVSLPHFGHPGQTLKTAADVFQTVTTAYTETGAQGSADLTRRYGKTSFLTFGGSLTLSKVEDTRTGTLNILTGRLLGAFAYDRADDPLNPRRGFKLDARVEPTTITGDETIAYLKLQAQGSVYLPIDRDMRTVLAGRIRAGSIIGGRIPAIPASDRFYAGGGGSVRGYEYQTVGPHYADSTPVGGLSLIEGSLELRRQITPVIGGVLFVDTGTVGGQIQPDFRHTDTAVGFGLRYNLGFAPIRFDVAFPLQKPSSASQQAFQIYLSIGQAF